MNEQPERTPDTGVPITPEAVAVIEPQASEVLWQGYSLEVLNVILDP